MSYDMVYRWKKFRPELFRKRCRLLARLVFNSALVEFEGGERHVVSRNSLARVKS